MRREVGYVANSVFYPCLNLEDAMQTRDYGESVVERIYDDFGKCVKETTLICGKTNP